MTIPTKPIEIARPGEVTEAIQIGADEEAALRASHDQFSALINNSPLRVFLVDSALKVRQVNEKARSSFGQIENFIGMDLLKLMTILWPAKVAAEILDDFKHTLQTGKSCFKRGFSQNRADRNVLEHYDWEIHRVTLPDGQFGAACYLTDISAHIQAQQALIERARLAALRAEISNALATSDNLPTVLQHCAQALVTHLDGAFARIWTVDNTGEFLELQASAGIYTHLNGPHARIKVGEFKIGRIAKNHQPLLTNDVLNDKNISSPDWARKEGMVAFAGYPLILENKVLGVMAMFARHILTDNVLTELAPIADGLAQWVRRRRAEESLTKAQLELQQHAAHLEQTVEDRTAELREKIGELEAFSYSVSHDMRSPLRAMQGYSTALLEDYSPKLDDEGRIYLERIHKAAVRMDLLIQEVLTYSKIAKENLTLSPIHLEHLIFEICQSYPALQSPHAQITVQGPFPLIQGHEALLTQVISNLLGNAVKFIDPGVLPKILISGELKGETVTLCIEDNGIGIDPAHFKRIFEIFGRVYGDKKFEGTGIGLAIVKKAMERMGGHIGVESRLGQGSRFWFTLKKAEAA